MTDRPPQIQWQEHFSLGIPDVDHEHRELIDLINAAIDAAWRDTDAGEEVPALLGEIYARITAHFALEERLMATAGYDALAPHKSDHERLIDQLAVIIDDVERGETADLEAFARAMDHWFTDHFRTHDARLHRRLGGGSQA